MNLPSEHVDIVPLIPTDYFQKKTKTSLVQLVLKLSAKHPELLDEILRLITTDLDGEEINLNAVSVKLKRVLEIHPMEWHGASERDKCERYRTDVEEVVATVEGFLHRVDLLLEKEDVKLALDVLSGIASLL